MSIAALYLTTHNWDQSKSFFQALGFDLEFETDHRAGQLRAKDGPYVFVAEVPADTPTEMHPVVILTGESDLPAGPAVAVVSPFTTTHWGAREALVRDPDGRVWRIQTAPK
ncbi:MAG: VOC family protein [Firmicutes bacterium]|nr:VOC family protein [Alicyclobacillaceae bacterium]MCL6498332.1 VOC family protein [Bacillota bacterium]